MKATMEDRAVNERVPNDYEYKKPKPPRLN
jgi:hypothetical protein